MSIVVLKFGGTSLKNKKTRTAAVDRIDETIQKGKKPVVIVSAIGREGSAYATDTLIKLAEDTFPELAKREKDLIMSCGEIISSVIMVQNLKKNEMDAKALTGAQAGILTDENFCNSDVLNINPENILKLINQDIILISFRFHDHYPGVFFSSV